jgi:acetoacetyl-CoA synthetase
LKQLKKVEKVVTIGETSPHQKLEDWDHFLLSSNLDKQTKEILPIEFVVTHFDHPVYIMFSSGTTGVPKCIIHGAGGTLLQHKKELILHTDIKENDKLFYFTTCGWMMWNWMVSTLSTGASLLTYDGSPGFPDLNVLWKMIEEEEITVFGTSPKYLQACINGKIQPKQKANLTGLKTVLSTGAPLLPEHFNWIYEEVNQDLHLASISGGTDIVSCFMLGNPLLPVVVGEIQSPGLGMAVEAWNEDGHAVVGEKAELVCTKPFVSMPIGFWLDDNGEKYRKAYFDHYKNPVVWRHGDFIEVKKNGGIVIHGRSDATLNPGGVRIGTAEIYRQVEKMIEIDDSLAVGRQADGDVEVILFVKLAAKIQMNDVLLKKIKTTIRSNLTPRHVPSRIFEINDIPYTRSGKKIEMAVTAVLAGKKVKNRTAMINPTSLGEYEKIYLDNFSKI